MESSARISLLNLLVPALRHPHATAPSKGPGLQPGESQVGTAGGLRGQLGALYVRQPHAALRAARHSGRPGADRTRHTVYTLLCSDGGVGRSAPRCPALPWACSGHSLP